MKTIKDKIHQICVDLIEQKVALNQKAMKDAQDAANKEQRSTAGDKYDTSRAMSQNERDMFARQLGESLQMKKALSVVNPNKEMQTAELGAMVITAAGNYYLSASCGKLEFEGQSFFAVSLITPIGQALLNKKAGDSFVLGGKSILIEDIQ